MASTFANRDTDWYIRTGGNELNGGGFDSTVAGAGTNYADQDSAQLSLSDLTTSGISASVISATGGFTSAMIGNVIRIASGSNFIADYYIIVSVASTNNATLDRTCSSGVATSGTCRIGGAHAHIKNHMQASAGGTANPLLAPPTIGGNSIYIRGSGSNDPSVSDYDFSGDWFYAPDGSNQTGGSIKLIGYNGRPRISHRGLMFYTGDFWFVKNISFFQSDPTWTTHCLFDTYTCSFYNCIFDVNGIDAQVAHFGNGVNASGSMVCCEIRNSGGGAAGSTNFGISHNHGGGFVFGTWVHHLRSNGIIANGCYGAMHQCLINNNLLNGYADDETDGSAPIPLVIMNCTFNNNAGHALSFVTNGFTNHFIVNNIFSNHTGSGKFAINNADAYKINIQKVRSLVGFNDYYGNTNNFNSISSVPTWAINPSYDGPLIGDLTLDPQYTNSASYNFTPGPNMIKKGLASALLPNTNYKLNLGGVFT